MCGGTCGRSETSGYLTPLKDLNFKLGVQQRKRLAGLIRLASETLATMVTTGDIEAIPNCKQT
jgi:hypothetical protein